MNKIKFLLIFLLLGCQTKKENYELTFFRWSIHEDYYLKINSSDTIYFIVDNPIEKQTKFIVIEKDEKIKLENLISHLSFPKEEHFSTNVEDGLSYAFVYIDKNKRDKLLIHDYAGPKQFWELGKYLEDIKNKSKFTSINRKIDLKKIQKLIFIPIPATFTIKAE
jgi:hypothetical protein